MYQVDINLFTPKALSLCTDQAEAPSHSLSTFCKSAKIGSSLDGSICLLSAVLSNQSVHFNWTISYPDSLSSGSISYTNPSTAPQPSVRVGLVLALAIAQQPLQCLYSSVMYTVQLYPGWPLPSNVFIALCSYSNILTVQLTLIPLPGSVSLSLSRHRHSPGRSLSAAQETPQQRFISTLFITPFLSVYV